MFRRDFLKAAAAAAFSGGVAAAAVIPSRPKVAVTASTSQFSAQIEHAKRMLADCRLVSVEKYDGRCITAIYRHDPDGEPTCLDKEWGEVFAGAAIRSLSVASWWRVPLENPVHEVTVEYVKVI